MTPEERERSAQKFIVFIRHPLLDAIAKRTSRERITVLPEPSELKLVKRYRTENAFEAAEKDIAELFRNPQVQAKFDALGFSAAGSEMFKQMLSQNAMMMRAVFENSKNQTLLHWNHRVKWIVIVAIVLSALIFVFRLWVVK
jgi:hypothetical protein